MFSFFDEIYFIDAMAISVVTIIIVSNYLYGNWIEKRLEMNKYEEETIENNEVKIEKGQEIDNLNLRNQIVIRMPT